MPPVTATAVREPVEKSYRKMIAGMDLFEKTRSQLAPQATLRFKLLPRRRDTNMEGIVLEILGDSVAIPVAVAADRTFTLERNQKALEEDASVTPNRRSRSMTWRTEIRTPGLPAGTRRLGDLRLAYFGVGATPVRARNAERAMAGGDVDAAVAALARDLDPPDDVQASGAVKRHLAGVLLRRIARQLREPPR